MFDFDVQLLMIQEKRFLCSYYCFMIWNKNMVKLQMIVFWLILFLLFAAAIRKYDMVEMRMLR